MIEAYNPDNDDLPDEEEADADPWVELNARRAARYERTRPRGQTGKPWETANESEKELARAVLVHLGEFPSHDAPDIAGTFGIVEWQARHAVWALVGSGFLRRERGKWLVREAVSTA